MKLNLLPQTRAIGGSLSIRLSGGASVLASQLVRSLAPPKMSHYPIGATALAALMLAGFFSAAAQETNRIKPNDFSAFRVITDRNIFDPNRRPRVASGPAPAIVDSFSLAGTMSYEKGRFAVFDGTSSEYHKVLEPGGSIAGYTVKEIRPDAVKLVSGTNQLELAVGMQMRRNAEGRWSVAELAESSGNSYASNSRRRETGARRSNPDSNRTGSQSGTLAVAPPEDQIGGAAEAGAPNPPPEAGSSDPNDPVARMMARRLQETGGNAGETRNGNQNGNDN